MSNQTPENEVKSKCLSRLDQWQRWGVVVDFDDLSNLGRGFNMYTGSYWMRTKSGKRDLIAYFKVGKILWVYLIECKSLVGVQSNKQKEYESKFDGMDNCIYQVVDDEKMIDETLDRITGRTKRLLDEGEECMYPKVVEEDF